MDERTERLADALERAVTDQERVKELSSLLYYEADELRRDFNSLMQTLEKSADC